MTTKNVPSTPRNLSSNPYFYTRDEILNLYSDDYELPSDVNTSLLAFVVEPRPPLAHLPLSESEKRLLNMVSINSEGNRRNNYRDQKQKNQRQSFTGNDLIVQQS
jgi:hypothetical protein